jgi:DNA polymerase-1
MFEQRVIFKKEELNLLEDYLKQKDLIALDIETTGLDEYKDDLLGIGVGCPNQQFFIASQYFSKEEIKDLLSKIFENNRIIVLHNAKFDLKFLAAKGLPIPEINNVEDTMLMAWLIDENNNIGLKNLIKRYLNRESKTYQQLIQESILQTEEERLTDLGTYCCDDVKNTIDLYAKFIVELNNQGVYKDYKYIEIPFIKVLMDMELWGIRVDSNLLEKYKEELGEIIRGYANQLREICGNPNFNPNSPKQIEEYLFTVCGYNPIKITRTGKRSTNSYVLEDIVAQNNLQDNDFVSVLLKYRELEKIYSTNIIPLLELRDQNERVHTTFLQHGTISGRLSSQGPNLQNIPVRDDEWSIKKCFVPAKGYKLVVADYSQVELRVLAHLSKDIAMTETFKMDGDIHNTTAKLTGTSRQRAKAINFGLIYGMSAGSLAKTLEIDYDDAQDYINRFFRGYPQAKNYIEGVYSESYKNGSVRTLSGRLRHLDAERVIALRNDVRGSVGRFKRMAINSKIQGSAADIIKIAMIKLARRLEPFSARLLLQIHDELVIETPNNCAEEVMNIVKNEMEHAIELSVPLKVEIETGESWG